MIDIKGISESIKEDIDKYCIELYSDGHRNHMGASVIGDECSRKTWSTFRWLKNSTFDGRTLRLFNRGKLEETRIVEWLKGCGFEVNEFDENGDQFRVSDVGGHFGGSLDGLGKLPAKFNLDIPIVFEFKTSKTGKPFNETVENGVKVAKNVHWTQMCIYGYKRNIKHAVYIIINKNDDSIYPEFVELDFGLAQDQIRKAEHLITSQRPPVGISKSATDFRCKMCTFVGICHQGEPVEKNCRSCLNASPIADAKWICSVYGGPIPEDVIKTGCATHVSIV